MGRARIDHTFRGSLVSLPTPFHGNQVDEEAFEALVQRQKEARTNGIVVGGTTGEGHALSEAERSRLFELAVKAAGGELSVLAAVGATDTRLMLRLARAAQASGSGGVVAVTPPYAVPGDAGLLAYFDALASSVPQLPVVLQNVPQRTGSDLRPELVRVLASRHRNVVAIQEATRDLERIAQLSELQGIDLLAGDDAAILDFLRHGAVGAVSVVGNLLPVEVSEFVGQATLDPFGPRVLELEQELAPLVRALFLESNPAPLKAALALRNGQTKELRLPHVPVQPETHTALESALEHLERARVAAV